MTYKANGSAADFIVDSDGNVGVGTSNPLNQLHVKSSNGNVAKFEYDGDGQAAIDFNDNAQNWRVGLRSSADEFFIRDNTSGYNNIRIIPGSNAELYFSGTRIGFPSESSPDATLELVKSGSDDLLNLSSTAGYDGDLVTVDQDGNMSLGISDPVAKLHIHNDNNALQYDSAFVVTDAGHVGIGTASPASNFEIKDGNAYINGGNIGIGVDPDVSAYKLDINCDVFTGIRLRRESASQVAFVMENTLTSSSWLHKLDATFGDFIIGQSSGFNAILIKDGLANPTTALTIATDGDIGIGTTSPTYNLDVVGSAGVDDYIYHNDDPNSYIGFDAADSYKMTIGGNDVLTANSTSVSIGQNTSFDGNLGIGTTNPTSQLDIESASGEATALVELKNTAGSFQIYVSDGDPNSAITGNVGDLANDVTNGDLYFKTSGTATNTGWSKLEVPTVDGTSSDPTPLYILGNKSMYAPTNITTSKVWGPSTATVGASSTTDGEANTAAIVAYHGAGNYAAYYCDTSTANGYTDWYLPALDEMAAIATLKGNIPGLEDNQIYWTSTENGTAAYSITVKTGTATGTSFNGYTTNNSHIKTSTYASRIRCIRRDD